MPTAAGPNTFGEENLVFGYDTGDTVNSYRGEPTVNVVANPLPTTGWSVSAGTQGSALTRTYLEEDGKPFMRFSGVTNGNDYPRVTNSTFANSATITGTFSTSLEVRGTPGAVLRFRIYENGSTKITNTITLTSEWTRYTFDNQSTGFNLNQPYFNPDTSNAVYDIRNIQVEAKSHATPFTAGTRSATQGLIDLTGNSTIDLTNVSFDSDAQMTFDGTDDYAFTSATDFGTPSDISFECIIRFNGTLDANDRKVFHIDKTGSTNAVFQLRKGSANRNLLYQVHDGSSWTTMTDNDAIYSDTWAHFAVTHQGTSAVMYKNGVQTTTATMGQLDWTDVNNLIIGHRVNAEYWKGDIAVFKIYNRALTASEIKANYNAIKGRFNI